MSEPEPTLTDVLDAVHEVSRTVHRHTGLLEEHGRKLDAHDRRFDEIDRRFDEFDRRFGEFDHRFGVHARRFDEHSDMLRSLSAGMRDVWQLLGTMTRRNTERFDNLELQLLKQREEFSALKAHVTVSIGVLKDLIEARDFRLDDHGRRLNALENPNFPDR